MQESTIALIAVAIAAVANCVLQVMQRMDAAKVRKEAKRVADEQHAAAMKAQSAATNAQEAAVHAVKEAQDVKTTLVASSNATGRKLDENTALTRQMAQKVSDIDQTANVIHKLVNSATLATLRLNAGNARWKANQTQDAQDVAAADLAEREVRDHEAKQAEADAYSARYRYDSP